MKVPAGIDDRPGWIHGFCNLPGDAKHLVILPGSVFVPGLVEWTPADDGRVIVIPFHSLHPFRQKAFQSHGSGNVQPPACGLSPDQISHLIRPIQIFRLKNLLMKPCSVKAHLHGNPDILFQIFLSGSRIDPIRIKSLIQHKPLKNRLSVDGNSVVPDGYRSQPKITPDPVNRFLPFLNDKIQIIQLRLSRFPQMDFLQLYGKICGFPRNPSHGASHASALIPGFRFQQKPICIPLYPGFDMYPFVFRIRKDFQGG